jgi:hypothetical protein
MYLVLTWRLDPLHDLFRIFRNGTKFRNIIRTANLEKGIKDPEFQLKKERILILIISLENTMVWIRDQIRNLGGRCTYSPGYTSRFGTSKSC